MVLAAPVNGEALGAGGTAVLPPVEAMVEYALELLAGLVPVTRGMRIGVVVVVATGVVDEARTMVW